MRKYTLTHADDGTAIFGQFMGTTLHAGIQEELLPLLILVQDEVQVAVAEEQSPTEPVVALLQEQRTASHKHLIQQGNDGDA
jgi:ATP:corrinoid adenosyltransferase